MDWMRHIWDTSIVRNDKEMDMNDTIKFAIVAAALGIAVLAMPAIAQEDAYTCIDRHPNGVEVWGCFDGEPYWQLAQFAGDRPMVSGGTLYMPSHARREPGMGGRIVNNAIHDAKWRTEAEINRKVERKIGDVLNKIF